MTNSSPSNEQRSPKPNFSQLEEWVAVIVALLSMGSIFFWVMLRDNSGFSLKSPEILVSSTQPSESSEPPKIIGVKPTVDEEPESSIQLDDSPEIEKTSSLPAKVESPEPDKSRAMSALAPLAMFGLSSTVSAPMTATPETSETSEATDAETVATDAETVATDAETAATDAETAATDAETAATEGKTETDATTAETVATDATTETDATTAETAATEGKTETDATDAETAATDATTDPEATDVETAATEGNTDPEATDVETAATEGKTETDATTAETAATEATTETDATTAETAATEATTETDATTASQTSTPPIEFADVADNYWAKPVIESMVSRNMVNGFPDGSFKPDAPMTRAELAVQLEKVFEQEAEESNVNYEDIPSDYSAAPAIKEVSQTGFLTGYPGDVFRPEQQVPRVQVLVAIASGLNLELPDNPEQLLKQYKDAADIPNYAIAKIAAATEKGLVVNYPDRALLNPNEPATRAEVSAMIYQALVISGKVEPLSNPYVVQP